MRELLEEAFENFTYNLNESSELKKSGYTKKKRMGLWWSNLSTMDKGSRDRF